jgi:hypothetical protein
VFHSLTDAQAAFPDHALDALADGEFWKARGWLFGSFGKPGSTTFSKTGAKRQWKRLASAGVF